MPENSDGGSKPAGALQPSVPVIAETGFGAIAAVVGLAWPPAAVLAAAAPLVGEAIARRIGAAVSDGEAVLSEEGVTPEIVGEAINRNEAVMDLLRTSADGVLHSRDTVHRRTLARGLARGVKDDAQVEPALRVARALAQLDVPEVVALRILCSHRPERPGPNERIRYADTLFPDELTAEWGQTEVVIKEVMARLVAVGLAYDLAGATMNGILHWRATDFGREVIGAIQDEADRFPDSD